MIVRELVAKLGFDIDTSKLDKFKRMVDSAKSKIDSLQSGFKDSVSPEVQARIASITAYRNELKELSTSERKEVLELNAIEKQALSEVSRMERQRHQETIARIRGQRQALKEFGSAARDIGRKTTFITAAITGGFGAALKGSISDANKQKKGEKVNSPMSLAQLQAIARFNTIIDATKTNITEIRNAFVVEMLPALQEFLIPLNEWFKLNKELVKQRLKSTVEALGKAFSAVARIITKIVSALDPLIEKTTGWGVVIAGLMMIGVIGWLASFASSVMVVGTAIKALTVAMWGFLRTPFGLIVTGITAALALLVDEIYTTIKGGDSLINRFLNSPYWQFCKDRIDDVSEALKSLFSLSSEVAGFLNPMKQLESIKAMSKQLYSKLSGSKVKLFSELSPPEGLNQLKTEINGLKVFSSGEGNKRLKEFRNFEPRQTAISTLSGKSPQANKIEQKNSFAMTINVPKGTTGEQAKDISKIVEKEVGKQITYHNEKMLNAVGVY